MQKVRRFMFVPPLVVATCAVALLNGNVLCMAGGDHIAVEAKHDPGRCTESEPASDPHPCHGDESPGGCSDVSADLDLSKSGNRSSLDSASELTYGWFVTVPSPASAAPASASFVRGGLAPPPAAAAASLRSIVLII